MISNYLYYHTDTGYFSWITDHGKFKIGDIIPKEQLIIKLNGKNYRRSALIKKYFIEDIYNDCRS
jgi:hypothetical protein